MLDLYDKSLTGVSLFVQEYYGVRGALGERLFQLVGKESGGSDGVTLEDLIISKVGTSGLVLDSIRSILSFSLLPQVRIVMPWWN